MHVVAVINHKGGVGKTTLTANLGAGLAANGNKVLLVDLDSQASLTLSFVDHDFWLGEIEPTRTVKHWFDHLGSDDAAQDMAKLVTRPPRVNSKLIHSAGYLDLLAGHRDLSDVESELSGRLIVAPDDYALVHHRLRAGIRSSEMREYDFVVIDCAPHFGAISRNAVASSEFLLIPTRPDYISTNGIHTLGQKIRRFVDTFNERRGGLQPIVRPPAAVVFTMVQSYGGRPMADQRKYLNEDHDLPAFNNYISDSKATYGPAPRQGVPVILDGTGRSQTRELRYVVAELMATLKGTPT